MVKNNLLIKEKIASKPKYWLRLSYACNNNCLFCLDKEAQSNNEQFVSEKDLQSEIKQALKEGYRKIILSGGEPTIHPRFLHLVKFCQNLGFERIQIITNGRMLAYRKFARQTLISGVNEVTFSLHGLDAQTHDYLVGVEGAYDQLIQGLHNIRASNCIINIDIVLNKKNIKQVHEIIDFFSKNYSIYEYDLLHLIPFGNAFKNLSNLVLSYKDYQQKSWQKVLTLAKNDKRYFIWTNRLPAQYLEDHEALIQDPHKLSDELKGRRHMFENYLQNNKELACKDGQRCAFCFLHDFCLKLSQFKENINYKPKYNIKFLTQKNLNELNSNNLIVAIKNFEFLEKLKDQTVNLDEFKNKTKNGNLKFINLPYCLAGQNNQVVYDFLIYLPKVLNNKKQIDLHKFAKMYISNLYYLKSVRCDDCKYNNQCAGWHINYLRYYGFKILKPVK
ncbi:MAG: radical SAM protein [Candidatus Buchananbacteria bacterium]|nr:radical SAM protein [Candidatus Buchananbacteria bacterium]